MQVPCVYALIMRLCAYCASMHIICCLMIGVVFPPVVCIKCIFGCIVFYPEYMRLPPPIGGDGAEPRYFP